MAAANEVDLRELPNSSLRILWIRSFHELVIFTLSKSKDTHLIVTKTLAAADGADKNKIKSVYSNEIDETHANYVYQTLTKTCGFFALPAQLPPTSMDGSTIVIELYTGGSYHVVETQSMKSSDCINKLSRLVLVLSGVDFSPIY
mgnify:CR=1 FL=1